MECPKASGSVLHWQKWAFNTERRDKAPENVQEVLRWVSNHSRRVADYSGDTLLAAYTGIAKKLDGTPNAASVAGRRQRIFNTRLEYAVEKKLLPTNPIPALRRKSPTARRQVTTIREIDRRAVVNPVQARVLLQAVRDQRPSGPRLVAFFGCIYVAAYARKRSPL